MDFIKRNNYIVFLMAAVILLSAYGTVKNISAGGPVEVTVEKGDTLWELSSRYADQGSREKWISQVISMNDLQDSTIITGQTIILPGSGSHPDWQGSEMAGSKE